MRKLLLALALVAATGCVPNYAYWVDADGNGSSTSRQPVDTDVAWCMVPFHLGGDGSVEKTTVADARTRPYMCYEDELRADRMWHAERETVGAYLNSTS